MSVWVWIPFVPLAVLTVALWVHTFRGIDPPTAMIVATDACAAWMIVAAIAVYA